MYRPGQLNESITIYAPDETKTSSGGFVRQQVVFLTGVRARVIPMGGSEGKFNGLIEAKATFIFVVRNRQDLKEQYTIEWLGERFNIRLIKTMPRRSLYLEIIAEKGVAL